MPRKFTIVTICLSFVVLVGPILSAQDPLAQYIEFSQKSLPKDGLCQTRFATDEELKILKDIRAFPVDKRLELLNSTIDRMVSDDLDQLPIEYISHAVVGADASIRTKVIQTILLKRTEAYKNNKRLAKICARIALDLEAVDQVPQLVEPAVEVVAHELARSGNRGELKFWQAEFEQLTKLLTAHQRPIMFAAIVDAFLVSCDAFYEKAKSNPAAVRAIEFREVVGSLQDLSIFANDVGDRLTDKQLIASQQTIEKLNSAPVAYRTQVFSKRLRKLGFDPNKIDSATIAKRLKFASLIGDGPGRGRGPDNENISTMEDLVRAIKPDSVMLAQFGRFRIPDEKLSMETGQELATIMVNKLMADEKLEDPASRTGSRFQSGGSFERAMKNAIEIIELVQEYIPPQDAKRVFDKLIPEVNQRHRSRNYSVGFLSLFCSEIQGEDLTEAIEKVLSLSGTAPPTSMDALLASLFHDLEPTVAKSLMPRVEKLNLIGAELMLTSRLEASESRLAFSRMFKEAQALEDPLARLKSMSAIGLFSGHDPKVALKCFEMYVSEFVKLGDTQPMPRRDQTRFSMVGLPQQFKDRIGTEGYLNAIMARKAKLDEWPPSSFTDRLLRPIANDAKALTTEQAKSLGDIWARLINRDGRQNTQTMILFSVFVQARPQSERAFFVAKMMPCIIGGNFRSRSTPSPELRALVDSPVAAMAPDQAKDVYLAALARSRELEKLGFDDGYLLIALAQAIGESHQKVAIEATIDLMETKNDVRLLNVFTNSLSKMKTELSVEQRLSVLKYWHDFLLDPPAAKKRTFGVSAKVLPIAEILEGISEPHASKVSKELLEMMSGLLGFNLDGTSLEFTKNGDIAVDLLEVLVRVKPMQSEQEIEKILFLLAELSKEGEHPVSLGRAEASIKKIRGTTQAGGSFESLKTARQMMANSRERTKVKDGLKLIDSTARLIHPDDADQWYVLALEQFTNENADMTGYEPESVNPVPLNPNAKYLRQDMFQKGADALRVLGEKLTPQDSAKHFARLAKLKEYITEENRGSFMGVVTPLLANIAVQDFAEFETQHKLIEEEFPSKLKQRIEQRIENQLLKTVTQNQAFIEIADRQLAELEGRARQIRLSRILSVAIDKPIDQSIELFKHYGSDPGGQFIARFYLAQRITDMGTQNRPTSAELINAFDDPGSVGFVKQMIKQRNRNYPPKGAVLWESRN